MSMKTISVRLNNEFDRKVRIEAARRDLDRSEFIRQTLVEKLNNINRGNENQKVISGSISQN